MNGSVIPNLYVYNQDYIADNLKRSGYSDLSIDEIFRDSTGSKLYLYDLYRVNRNNIILSISEGGNVKKLVPPADVAYLNDKGEFVAWFNDIKKGVQFKNGMIKNVPLFGDFDIDPSGQYFFISYIPEMKVINGRTFRPENFTIITEIASIDNPDKPLAYSKIEAEKIFFRNEKIYLFARSYRNVKGPGDYEQHEIICHIFRKTDSSFELEEEIHIPRPSPRHSPFAVLDMDPWTDNVLLVDVRDMPFSFLTAWYLFDLKTKKMTKIGRAKDYGFFLREDILRVKDK